MIKHINDVMAGILAVQHRSAEEILSEEKEEKARMIVEESKCPHCGETIYITHHPYKSLLEKSSGSLEEKKKGRGTIQVVLCQNCGDELVCPTCEGGWKSLEAMQRLEDLQEMVIVTRKERLFLIALCPQKGKILYGWDDELKNDVEKATLPDAILNLKVEK
jgi:ribosomal protein S27E